MYQGLALAPNHGQSAYSHDSSNFLHSSAGSPVYVPTTRVPSVLQTLPYLQGCEPHQSHLANPPGWGQTSGEASAFNAGSPHPPSGFSYSHSPPGSSPPGRDGAYQGPLLLGGGGREQYGNALVRSVNGSYSSPYPAYVTPEIPPSWTAGHFESSVLHSLQTRQAALPGRRSTFGRSPSPVTVVSGLAESFSRLSASGRSRSVVSPGRGVSRHPPREGTGGGFYPGMEGRSGRGGCVADPGQMEGGVGCVVCVCHTEGKDRVSKRSNSPAGQRSGGRPTPSPPTPPSPRYLLPTISTLCLRFNTYPCV